MIEFLSEPWPWYIAGPMITVVMVLLTYFGYSFGVSSNLRTLCSIGGAGKYSDFFKFNWKDHSWNLVFILGGLIGGFIAANYLSSSEVIDIHPETIESLKVMGVLEKMDSSIPAFIYSDEVVFSLKGFLYLAIGGLLVGFGTRYAGGCTSGHAISGLSNMQLPSLIAVIGFFIGGLIMTHLLLPLIF
jgi:uncharacterized membrane protein YedE/YeeE